MKLEFCLILLFLNGILLVSGYYNSGKLSLGRKIFNLQYRDNEEGISVGSSSDVTVLPTALLLSGLVTEGYGRGSKQIGVPTANLPHFDNLLKDSEYKNGVYFGWGRVEGDTTDYPIIANIGKSPTFEGKENPVRIVEAHLIDRVTPANEEELEGEVIFSDFYDKELRIALVAFLRPEIKFNSIDELIKQIKFDVSIGQQLGSTGQSPFDDYRGMNCLRSRLQQFMLNGELPKDACNTEEIIVEGREATWSLLSTDMPLSCGDDGAGI